MPRYTTKEDLLQDIRVQHSRLKKNIVEYGGANLERPGVCGEWSVKDIMAHLMDWEQRFIGWYNAGKRGEIPQTPAPGLTWGKLDLLNQQIYEKYRNMPLQEVYEKFTSSYQQILELAEAMTIEELFSPGFYAWNEHEPLVGWLAANTSSHYAWAKTLVRKAIKHTAEQES